MASSRSIRFKISALLVIPLLSLTALWIFGTSVTTRDSLNLLTVASMYEEIGKPGDELTVALQREHVLSAEYIGAPSQQTQNELIRQRQQSDILRQRMRRLALTESAQAKLSTPDMRARFADLMAVIDRLDTTRTAIDSGPMDLLTLARDFSQVPDAMQKLVTSMTLTSDVALYHQSQSLTAMGYAKDHLSRERALAAGAFIANRPLTTGELRLFAQLATTRRFLFDQGLPELEPAVREPFDKLARSEAYRRFSTMEDEIILGGGSTFSHTEWRSATDEVESSYQATLTRAGAALAASAEPVAVSAFVRAGLAGAIGLIAVVSSLIVAYRVGRRLTRELGDLRSAATELATVRLPRLVERLREGEDVDTTIEAPPLAVTATTTEVRDLTAAFSSVQCTAVRAAVEQATLREAVGQAFRNLARRSQSLLQRQLKLLDGMQRRVEDPETLRDLFRVDHHTTRMRRHAEGLVILSGGSPGRTFRQDVPVMDALRAAVGEVEDYTRVRVHPMPEAAIVGNAVADVIHLCAELIENATSFSPPNTEVSVHGEFVARGFAVEIEDRGLGMTLEERDALNEKLSRPPEFDPADTQRLGLFVIGRLAARHDIQVELCGSPYGGTTVIVLIPDRLITKPERPGAPQARPTPPPARSVAPSPRSAPLPSRSATLPTRSRALPERPASPPKEPTGLPRRARSLPTRPSAAQAPAPRHAADGAPASRTASGEAPASGNAGLPRRVRQANLAPQLRQQNAERDPATASEPQAGASTRAADPRAAGHGTAAQGATEQGFTERGSRSRTPADRSPEESRALLNSLQSGWRRGRADSERDGEEV
ncbi:nitrate- and nitrite sensing domain-containing protein [Sphaerisporangium perillae]|uniref:nitrate- and nitrite sensing domain-containing protein n=1 Tax=Sphaerisporangium perillae TaxID=2935860 RepID=UPI00200D14E3|nr:nitrate- and nitrite sensing domain-containing protein [Sphaerisporangium perillae]